jgi:hypothetical protein
MADEVAVRTQGDPGHVIRGGANPRDILEMVLGQAAWLVAAAALLAAVSLGASLVPARRGSRVDPIVVLRYD